MFSKLQSATAMMGAVMIGSLPETEGQIVPPPQYDYTSALSCSQCIQAGYQYVYDSGASSNSQYYMEIPSGSDYTGFCCTELDDGRLDCNDEVMWKTWTSVVSKEESEDFNTNFSLYFDAFALEQTRAIVAELYNELPNKTTDEEKKYFFLGLSARITISHNEAGWAADVEADDPGSTILSDLISDIEDLSANDMLGDLFRKTYSQLLIQNMDTYYNQGSAGLITLQGSISEVQDKVDVWRDAMAVVGDDGTKDYTEYIQELFTILYSDGGIIKYETTEDFDITIQETLDGI